jgi:hypothetical protein
MDSFAVFVMALSRILIPLVAQFVSVTVWWGWLPPSWRIRSDRAADQSTECLAQDESNSREGQNDDAIYDSQAGPRAGGGP